MRILSLIMLLIGCTEVPIQSLDCNYVESPKDLKEDLKQKEYVIHPPSDFQVTFCGEDTWKYLELNAGDDCIDYLNRTCFAELDINKDWKNIRINIQHEWNVINSHYNDLYVKSAITFGVYDKSGTGSYKYISLTDDNNLTTTSNIFDITNFIEPTLILQTYMKCFKMSYIWKWKIYNVSVERLD